MSSPLGGHLPPPTLPPPPRAPRISHPRRRSPPPLFLHRFSGLPRRLQMGHIFSPRSTRLLAHRPGPRRTTPCAKRRLRRSHAVRRRHASPPPKPREKFRSHPSSRRTIPIS